jgi:acetoacetyl-CoA synthetase
LPPEGFVWLYEQFGDDVWVVSASGGTDIATTFVGGTPTLPVRAGEIQCRSLGAAVAAYDEDGNPLIGQVGELVVTEPMPSMPLYLWNDEDGSRYRSSYYDTYPGAWRHGDWIKITDYGSAVITGRSDSTINRKGVRIGSSELYSVVEEMSQVNDSVVIDVGEDHNTARLMLFVVLADGVEPDDGLMEEIASRIRTSLSPRHVPDELHVIAEVPRTLNGKKLEVPIKRLLQGTALDDALNVDSMSNPESIRPFLKIAGLEVEEDQ